MATETGENRYKKYGQPTLDLQFSGPKGSISNRADGGAISVEFLRTQDTQSSYVKSDGTIGYASTDVARFDHDPVTGESLGLLMEESRTNYLKDGTRFTVTSGDGRTGPLNGTFSYTPAVNPTGATGTTLFTTDVVSGTNITIGGGDASLGNVGNSMSMFIKPNGITKIFLTTYATAVNQGAYFELTGSGSVVGYQNNLPPEDAFIEAYSNGWYRLGVRNFARIEYSLKVWEYDGGSNPQFTSVTGDGTSGFYIWGWQNELAAPFWSSYILTEPTFTSRASNATYYDQNGIVSIAATDVARDDAYLPDENGVFYPVGLLLEEERDNILLHSKDFSSTWDGSTYGTLTLNATTSPDGTNNAALFQSDGASTSFLNSGLFQTYTSIGSTTTVTNSLFVKDSNAGSVRIIGGSLNNRAFNGTFDFGTEDFTGTGSSLGEDVFTNVEKHNNGWYRISVTCTPGYPNSRFAILPNPGIGNTQGVYVWGAQLEEGSYATSYIPTTSGISTRAADISSSSTSTRERDLVQITGSNFSSLFPSVGSGSVFVEGDVIGEKLNTSLGSFASFGTNDNNNFLYFLAYDNRDNVGFIQPSGGNVSKYHDLTGKTFKGATAWTDLADAPSTGISALDGDLYGGNHWGYSGVQNPANYDRFGIGRAIRSSTTFNTINGHIKRLTYWPTRLSDSDLQRLTE
jgi:hypothetical protein